MKKCVYTNRGLEMKVKGKVLRSLVRMRERLYKVIEVYRRRSY